MGVHASVYACMQRPKFDVGGSSLMMFYFIHSGRLSQSIWLVLQCGLTLRNSPSLPSSAGITGGPLHPASLWVSG